MASLEDLILGNSSKPEYSVEDVTKMIHGQESNFGKINTSKPNYADAQGEMQITAPTFQGLKNKGLIPQNYDINNPKHSKKAGEILVQDLYKKHNGDADKVLAEYYSGPSAINKDGSINTQFRDLKNPKAPTVGQYIEQAKSRLQPQDELSNLILGSKENPQTEKTTIQKFVEPLKNISYEDWKQKSLAAPLTDLMSPLAGPQTKLEALNNLVNKGVDVVKGINEFSKHPIHSLEEAYKEITTNPGGAAGEFVKSLIYDPELLIAPELRGAKAVSRVSKVETPIESTLKGVGAAKSEINPYAGLKGEEYAKGEYPTIKTSKIAEDVPKENQATRAQIANEIMGDGQVRPGVVTGNENTLRNEYLTAKKAEDTPKGELLKKQITNEQNALSDYAQKRIEATGADQNLVSDYERGQRLNDAIASEEGLTGFLNTERNKIWKEAENRVGNNPVSSEDLDKLINSQQFKAGLKLKGNKDFTEGMNDLLELHKTEGLEGHPANSIASLIELRKYANQMWSPENKYAIGKVVKAIDEDIGKAGGEDLYKKAINFSKAEKTIFDSKGMKNIFGSVDANGVQTATAFEQLPQKLNSMKVDEWKHVYDTLDQISKGYLRGVDFDVQLTPELKQYAEAAKAEMKGSLAREIFQAGAKRQGVWDQNAVTNILNARAEKIKHAFSPDEQKAFHTLNYGGHIMPGVHHYEGGALQAERLSTLEKRAGLLAKGAGILTGSPYVTIGAEKAAEFGKSKLAARRQIKEAKILKEEMQKNSQLGKNKLSDIGK